MSNTPSHFAPPAVNYLARKPACGATSMQPADVTRWYRKVTCKRCLRTQAVKNAEAADRATWTALK